MKIFVLLILLLLTSCANVKEYSSSDTATFDSVRVERIVKVDTVYLPPEIHTVHIPFRDTVIIRETERVKLFTQIKNDSLNIQLDLKEFEKLILSYENTLKIFQSKSTSSEKVKEKKTATNKILIAIVVIAVIAILANFILKRIF